MVGRQTPFLALIVPLILVAMVDGTRGMRQTWPAAVVGGLAFAHRAVRHARTTSPSSSTDIVASLVSTGAIVAAPARLAARRAAARRGRRPPALRPARRGRRVDARPGAGGRDRAPRRPRRGPAGDDRARLRAVPDHHRGLLDRADRGRSRTALGERLDARRSTGPAWTCATRTASRSASLTFNVQLAAGRGHAAADLRPAHDGWCCGSRPARALRVVRRRRSTSSSGRSSPSRRCSRSRT